MKALSALLCFALSHCFFSCSIIPTSEKPSDKTQSSEQERKKATGICCFICKNERRQAGRQAEIDRCRSSKEFAAGRSAKQGHADVRQQGFVGQGQTLLQCVVEQNAPSARREQNTAGTVCVCKREKGNDKSTTAAQHW